MKALVVPPLHVHQAHVWCATLDYTDDELATFANLLTPEEQARAARFHFDKDRKRFVIARGLLRKILSQYVNAEPQALRFDYTAHGKPELQQHSYLQFNVSHSHQAILYAVTRAQAVGVDIEFMYGKHDIDAIAKRFFAVQEYAQLKDLQDDDMRQAFFNAWTRKEAFLKALGSGLSHSLSQVEVTLLPKQLAEFVALHDLQQVVSDWSLRSLDILPDYAAALVVKGKLKEVTILQIPSSF